MQDMQVSQVKVIIVVESCQAHQEREVAQLSTWAKNPPIDVVFLNGPDLEVLDDYKSLPFKTQAICQWAKALSYDYIFKVDTDTYVHVERLLNSGFSKYDYIGYKLDWLGEPGYASGPAYWLSKKAMDIVAKADLSTYIGACGGHHTCEDVMVGAILSAHGITVHNDPRYALYQSVLPDNDVISEHLSSRGAFQIEFMYAAHKKALGL